jgi:hypothetical protein
VITLSPLPKGAPLAVTGKLRWKSWEKDGKKQGNLVVSCFSLEVLGSAHEAPVAL